jgi:alanyl-tRNA synthetase
VQVVLNQTPFYAEAGGQVGDNGTLKADRATVTIADVRKMAGLSVHIGRVEHGELAVGAAASLTVDHDRRAAIRANHSATHLLHEALRRALGDHVAQRGSLVAPDRLRFDFAHGKAMAPGELAAVEAEVNAFVRQDTPVETRIMTPDDAQGLGARALFGEKYGDEVRVVSMGSRPGSGLGAGGDTYSLELCGGTHVGRTGEIGAFKLVSEGASASGIRRIEALTGAGALAHVAAQEAALNDAAGLLRVRPEELPDRVRALLEERRAQGHEIAELRRRLAMGGGGAAAPAGPETVKGIPFLAQSLTGVSGKDLRELIDEHKARLGSGVILLVADTGDKAAVAAGVTDDLTGRISAVDLVRAAAEALGGKGGGGRPDMAQAGGADAKRAPEAIAAARALLEA